jgi:hypothetical protein
VRDDTEEKAAPTAAALRPTRQSQPGGKAPSRKRRAPRKKQKLGRGHVALLALSGMLCLVLLAMITIVHADYRSIKAKADAKAELLTILRERQKIAKRRLAVLESGEGREQLLLDNGYIRPGERILLFPATPEERRAARKSTNDLSPHETDEAENNDSGSAWQRAGAVLGGWWKTLEAAAGLKQDKKQHESHN